MPQTDGGYAHKGRGRDYRPGGEPFDPNEHQAMSMVENPDMEPNSVLAVVQKGCKLNGRLVRPAMVMVQGAAKSETRRKPKDIKFRWPGT